ncbi:Bystin [Ceraceosorus guamensis]|uniref:Bystin n=1 Tax=Ceraceosorus guamensis TaxID=1522189 RepID=A0A316VZI7_9BASI|nr:Bystin [Ceraceosorus guamensis]PWN42318.1 Bystin [Ceraceosorus guamensis]
MAKIKEAEARGGKTASFKLGAVGGQEAQEDAALNSLPPGVSVKVGEAYTKVGMLLSRYKSGPLPKAFKIIPSLPNWDAILYLTNPSGWTSHATLAATRILCSNLKPSQSQRFFKYVLLPKFREQVQDTGKVTPQVFEACIKAVYKPAAFFKGLLFPLAEAGCTLKEAAIMSAVLSRVSIPVLHSAAALLRLSEMHYRGPTSLFIRTLLDKKYALPYKVVDALVFHFLRFSDPEMGVEKNDDGEKRMPVLWHQSFLVFCQRYKQDLTPDQKAALLDLLRVQKHDSIGPDIRRELTTGHARGEMLDEPIDEDMDDAISL